METTGPHTEPTDEQITKALFLRHALRPADVAVVLPFADDPEKLILRAAHVAKLMVDAAISAVAIIGNDRVKGGTRQSGVSSSVFMEKQLQKHGIEKKHIIVNRDPYGAWTLPLSSLAIQLKDEQLITPTSTIALVATPPFMKLLYVRWITRSVCKNAFCYPFTDWCTAETWATDNSAPNQVRHLFRRMLEWESRDMLPPDWQTDSPSDNWPRRAAE
jgi:hypothetical protein